MVVNSKKRKEKKTDFKNVNFSKDTTDSLESLRKKIKQLEDEKVEFEKKLNQKFLALIEKKSSEASEILKKKQVELDQKYKNEFDQMKNYIYEKQFSSLVEILSQFEKILELPVTSPELKNYFQGFKMFFAQFDDLLVSLNIKKIEPKIGDDFNSEFMIAVATDEIKDKNLENKVLEVVSKGYKLHSRVIKLASVKVGLFKN